jgi:hypothetical protein
LFSCHVVHSTIHVILLSLIDRRIYTSMAYLRLWLSEPLNIAFLGSLDVTIWTDAGIMSQFSTIETTIRVNWSCFSLVRLSDFDDDLDILCLLARMLGLLG